MSNARFNDAAPGRGPQPAPTAAPPAPAAAAGPAARPSPFANPKVRFGLIAGAVLLAAVAAVSGFNWWVHGRFIQGTNDAYLRADQVTVSPKVSGYVEQVFVTDNQAVEAGAPLVRIDSRSYDAALAQQAAGVDARRADIAAAERQIAQQRDVIDQAQAQLAGARANAAYAAGEAQRFQTLSAQGVETQERNAQARNQRDQALSTVKADEAALAGAQRQLATLGAQVEQAKAQLEAAQAQARTAQLNLGDTVIRASEAGRIGDKTVRVGQLVQPGTRLMSVVPVQQIYLVANFKETQIGHMRIGQPATVKLDALGGKPIRAVVDSFSPGTGAEFALLPPENATGNFTKVVQRVPVRLRLEAPAELRDHLLPGLSATVKVDTSAAPEPKK
jgi:membrane fusion protein (multidrug efflux system)